MTTPLSLSDTGRSSLKQIAHIRDFLDYYLYLCDGDPATGKRAPLSPPIAKLYREQGVDIALGKLLADFNSNPADVKEAARIFNLKLPGSNPRIKAVDLGAAALTARNRRADLWKALKRVRESRLSKVGKKYLSQILYIRDFLDYYLFLREGDPKKGRRSPLAPAIAKLYGRGIDQALGRLLADFNRNRQDVRAAVSMFGMNRSTTTLKAFEFGQAALDKKRDPRDLWQVLCKIDPNTCPTKKPAPPAPAAPPAEKSEPVPEAGALITWTPSFSQEMNSESPAWQKANWSNPSPPFNCTWQPDNASINNGFLTLTADKAGCPAACKSRPYASAEYRTLRESFGYGYYEARLKAAAGSGLITSFFVYAGIYGQSSHGEIDVEVRGKDCNHVQINYYVKGRGNHEQIIALPSNGCENFHNYGFRWSKDSIIWYIDGREVYRAEGDVPQVKTKIMVNLWPGIGVDGWLGPFTYPGSPIRAIYDWVRYSPLDHGPAAAPSSRPGRQMVRIEPTASTSGSESSSGRLGFEGLAANNRKGPDGSSPSSEQKTTATSTTYQSDYKDDARKSLARRRIESAFKNGLASDIGMGRIPPLQSGSAMITLEISPDGKVTVTGIEILESFTIDGARYSDNDMRGRIKKYLSGLEFPPVLRGKTRLTHQLVIPQI
jgi:endo-1,3-1,4-beta-glycanase ExoK